MGVEWWAQGDALQKLTANAAYGKNGAYTLLAHRNGVPWSEAPIPRRWHRCRVQTDALTESTRIQRCACGAIRDVFRGRWSCWVWKNTRRPKS